MNKPGKDRVLPETRNFFLELKEHAGDTSLINRDLFWSKFDLLPLYCIVY
jgi:hypothetical protein